MDGNNLGSEVNRFISNFKAMNLDVVEAAYINNAWRASQEDVIVEHTTGLFVVPNTNNSEVVVYVDSSLWTQELSLQSELLRLKLNMELRKQLHEEEQPYPAQDPMIDIPPSHEKVKILRFKTSKERYQSLKSEVSTEEELKQEIQSIDAEPVELTPEELAQLSFSVSEVEDEELREKLFNAAKTNLELMKGIESAQNA